MVVVEEVAVIVVILVVVDVFVVVAVVIVVAVVVVGVVVGVVVVVVLVAVVADAVLGMSRLDRSRPHSHAPRCRRGRILPVAGVVVGDPLVGMVVTVVGTVVDVAVVLGSPATPTPHAISRP